CFGAHEVSDHVPVVEQDPAVRWTLDALGLVPGALECLAGRVLHGLQLQARLPRGDDEPVEGVRCPAEVEDGDVDGTLVVERVDQELDLFRDVDRGLFGSHLSLLGVGDVLQTILLPLSASHGTAASTKVTATWSTRDAASAPSTSSNWVARPSCGVRRATCCLPACSSSAK